MKIKLLTFLLMISFCSSDVVDEGIFIESVDLNNLKTLDTNENIDLSNKDFLIINYWASWCLECIEEHELLISLSEIPELKNKILLVSFQDSEDNAISFLNKYGYGEITYVMDENSKFSINSGVFGVPETHIIKNNKIIKKYIGPLTFKNFQEIIDLYS